MTDADSRRHLRVGIMVASATALLAVLLLLKGSEGFGRRQVFYVELPSVEGLALGSDVMLRGYRVGHVDDIDLQAGPEPRFSVRIRVDRKARLGAGTRALVLPKGLTAAYLDLRLPPVPGSPLPSGSTLPGEAGPTFASLLTRADEALTGLARIAERLGREGLGSLLEHPDVRATAADLRLLAREAQGTAREARALAQDGRSLLAQNGPAVARSLAGLERNLAGAEAGLRDLRAYAEAHREALDHLPEAADQAARKVDTAAAQAEILMAQGTPVLETLHGALASMEELLEILKAKPNRALFGRVGPGELAAARARIRERRKDRPKP